MRKEKIMGKLTILISILLMVMAFIKYNGVVDKIIGLVKVIDTNEKIEDLIRDVGVNVLTGLNVTKTLTLMMFIWIGYMIYLIIKKGMQFKKTGSSVVDTKKIDYALKIVSSIWLIGSLVVDTLLGIALHSILIVANDSIGIEPAGMDFDAPMTAIIIVFCGMLYVLAIGIVCITWMVYWFSKFILKRVTSKKNGGCTQ